MAPEASPVAKMRLEFDIVDFPKFLEDLTNEGDIIHVVLNSSTAALSSIPGSRDSIRIDDEETVFISGIIKTREVLDSRNRVKSFRIIAVKNENQWGGINFVQTRWYMQQVSTFQTTNGQ